MPTRRTWLRVITPRWLTSNHRAARVSSSTSGRLSSNTDILPTAGTQSVRQRPSVSETRAWVRDCWGHGPSDPALMDDLGLHMGLSRLQTASAGATAAAQTLAPPI